MTFLALILLICAALTYLIAVRVTLRLAVVTCLAILLFAASLMVMPHDTIVERSNSGELPGMKELQYFVYTVAAGIGSVIGLITGWIVKRMRETAV